MKKIFLVALIMISFVGCSRNNNQIVGTIQDFFPFEANTTHIFESNDLIGNQEFFTAYVNNNKKQQRVTAHNNETTVVLSYEDGNLRQTFSFLRHYLYEDVTDLYENMNIVILSEPLKLGNSWERDDFNSISTITSVDAVVETPKGIFEAIEVTTEFANGDIEMTYYARDIGLIKVEYTTTTEDATINVVSYLKDIIRDEGFVVTKDFFFPDSMLIDLVVEKRDLIISAHQDFTVLFENELRKASSNNELPLINDSIQINYIEVDRERSLVTVDFSSNFLESVSGSTQENMVLQGLANTFTNFYRVEHFLITLDGNNYESGHFSFNENNFVTVP